MLFPAAVCLPFLDLVQPCWSKSIFQLVFSSHLLCMRGCITCSIAYVLHRSQRTFRPSANTGFLCDRGLFNFPHSDFNHIKSVVFMHCRMKWWDYLFISVCIFLHIPLLIVPLQVQWIMFSIFFVFLQVFLTFKFWILNWARHLYIFISRALFPVFLFPVLVLCVVYHKSWVDFSTHICYTYRLCLYMPTLTHVSSLFSSNGIISLASHYIHNETMKHLN